MSDYAIGINALYAVQKNLDVVGNNIANAATEGYHRQRIDLRPAASIGEGGLVFGMGVDVENVTRLIDDLVERELLRQSSLLQQVDSELTILRTVQNALGEFSSEQGGLNAAIDKFFNALHDLTAHPGDAVWQNQAVSDADAMASQFRTIGEFLDTLDTQIQLEADNVVESINTLTTQIAVLNDDIERIETASGKANNLRDERDQLIADLAKLVRVETISREFGVVDVAVSGIPVVLAASSTDIEAGLNDDNELGISIENLSSYITFIDGGKIGALLSLKNQLLKDIRDDLDSLADAIIQQINQYHVQGVGSAGSFTDLTGWTMTSENLSDISNVTDGSFFIRLTNTSTGAVTRHEIQVDTATDTVSTIAADIAALTGLGASVAASKITVLADANYEFDFLPCVLSSPTASDLNGTSPPTVTVSGIYTGSTNQTFTFTVSGTGSVGNGTLSLAVTDGDGQTVATLNVGSGYAAGDKLEVGNGIKVALGTGDLVDADTFEIDAFADSDTSGLLSALGLNTFFSGSGADDIAVCPRISADPSKIAASLGADMSDNTNAVNMADLRDEALTSLNSLTCGDFYRRVVTDFGQTISLKQMRLGNLEATLRNLDDQRNDISGVDINEEAAQLLVLEQMFQAIAKYMTTIRVTMDSLMQVI